MSIRDDFREAAEEYIALTGFDSWSFNIEVIETVTIRKYPRRYMSILFKLNEYGLSSPEAKKYLNELFTPEEFLAAAYSVVVMVKEGKVKLAQRHRY